MIATKTIGNERAAIEDGIGAVADLQRGRAVPRGSFQSHLARAFDPAAHIEQRGRARPVFHQRFDQCQCLGWIAEASDDVRLAFLKGATRVTA